jgi:hypothetical protein
VRDLEYKWRYERGEGRRKHQWDKGYAGFQPSQRGAVGKCPNNVTEEIAQKILNEEARPIYDGDGRAFPDRFYAVYKGVVYEAVPTQPGISYHAYPWRGDLPGRRTLSRRVRRELLQIADIRGEVKELERWLKKYGVPTD